MIEVNLWPLIQKFGKYNNSEIAYALTYSDGITSLLDRLHLQGEPINDNIYREAHGCLVAYLETAFKVHPVCKLNNEQEFLKRLEDSKNKDLSTLLIFYVSYMAYVEGLHNGIKTPIQIEPLEIDKFRNMLYDFDKEYWTELMVDCILGNTFEYNHKHKVVLSEDVLNEMYNDIYNRIFTVLENFADIMFEYYKV